MTSFAEEHRRASGKHPARQPRDGRREQRALKLSSLRGRLAQSQQAAPDSTKGFLLEILDVLEDYNE